MKILKRIIKFIIGLAFLALICWFVIYLVEHRNLPWVKTEPEIVTEIDGVKLWKVMDNGDWIYVTNHGAAYKKEGK